MNPTFESTADGLVVIDPIERCRYRLETATQVAPEPVAADGVPYLMDSAVAITTSEISVSVDTSVYVRDSDGSFITEVRRNDRRSLPEGEYHIDLSGSVKVYVTVESDVRISVDPDRSRLTFGDPTRVTISARSFHTRPGASITTTDDPADVMRAVSLFGSALKTTDSERSYPTLRGHPPTITVGEELRIPETLSRPETGVRIEIPPTLRHVFVVAPLAYYLAAEVVPGSTPRLVTNTGYAVELEGEVGFETAVGRRLRQALFLDCIVRTVGEIPVDLAEREAIEPELPFGVEELYGRPLAERLERYFEVPFDVIEPQLPEWNREARFEPTAECIEFLPFVVNDLSKIVVDEPPTQSVRPSRASPGDTDDRSTAACGTGPSGTTTEPDGSTPTMPTICQRWTDGSGTAITSTKPLAAFHNRIEQSPRSGPLTIDVVCNDPDMSDELVAALSTYRRHDGQSFDVSIHHDLTTTELEGVLTRPSDFVHYIGHIDADGFRCSDGALDATDLDQVGTNAFFLNACQSYDQGLALVDAGGIGGLATRSEIDNETAVDAGSVIARCLHRGLPLYAAVYVLQQRDVGDQQYHIIGEETLTVMQSEQASPATATVDRNGTEETYTVTAHSYVSSKTTAGTIYISHLEPVDSYRLVPGNVTADSVTTAQLVEFLTHSEIPVVLDGELRWSSEITVGELRD